MAKRETVKVTKTEVVNKLADAINEAGYKITKKDVKEVILPSIEKVIYEGLSETSEEHDVKIAFVDGLILKGTYVEARQYRNPLNGETVDGKPCVRVSAKAGTSLKNFLND